MGRSSTEELSFTVTATGRPPVAITDALAVTVEDAPCPHAASATIAIESSAHSASARRGSERALTPCRCMDAQRKGDGVASFRA